MSKTRTMADLVADGSLSIADVDGLTAYVEGEISDVTGPQGIQGIQGIQGVQGPAGAAGIQGPAATFSLTGSTLTITTG